LPANSSTIRAANRILSMRQRVLAIAAAERAREGRLALLAALLLFPLLLLLLIGP
jgi:hypothetical protein